MLKVKLLNENAQAPKRQTAGAAGYDIYSAEEYTIGPGEKVIVSTGIAIELPKCPIPGHIYCLQIMSRSGLSAKFSIEKGAGLIDADYTGEIKVILYNLSDANGPDAQKNTYKINIGDRIAQGVIVAVAIPEVEVVSEEVNDLCSLLPGQESNVVSERGHNGFGSTGK
jgi:dUTP pyrophosphatase